MFPTWFKVAGGAALAVVAYEFLKPKPRFPGDLAKVGDAVHVPSSLAVGAQQQTFPGVPGNVGAVSLQVQSATKDTLTGPVIALIVSETPLVLADLPAPTGSFTVPRSAVTQVIRNNARVA